MRRARNCHAFTDRRQPLIASRRRKRRLCAETAQPLRIPQTIRLACCPQQVGVRTDAQSEVELVGRTPSLSDIKYSIKKAMERNAKLDADSVLVNSSNGKV